MLGDVMQFLACPHCAAPLTLAAGTVRCERGHVSDVARQGYVSLLPGDARAGTADTAAMVQARADFLAAGHYEPLARRIAQCAADAIDAASADGCVADVGTGTGYYLSLALDRLPERAGLALDISKYALRRAARAHARIGAVACDIWRLLPVRDASAAVALSVFAPRNAAELFRVLPPGGALIVATPTARHLGELVSALGLLTVDERKQDRLVQQLSPYFGLAEQHVHEHPLVLTRRHAEAVVGMGPSARHMQAAVVRRRIAALAQPLRTTASVTVSVYRPRCPRNSPP